MRAQRQLRAVRFGRQTAGAAPLGRVAGIRLYHDESFGFRKPREFVVPDCERVAAPCERRRGMY